jgi:hypothetical protein
LRTGHQLPPRTTDNQRLLELLLHFFGFSPEVALSRYVLLSLPHSTLSHTHTAPAKVEDLRRVRKKMVFWFFLSHRQSICTVFFFFSSVAQCLFFADDHQFRIFLFFYFFSGAGGPCWGIL